MARKGSVVVLSSGERAELKKLCSRSTSEQRLVFRAKIILALSERLSVGKVSQQLDVPPKTIIKWGKRYLCDKLGGLKDAPRPGKPTKFNPSEKLKIIESPSAIRYPDHCG